MPNSRPSAEPSTADTDEGNQTGRDNNSTSGSKRRRTALACSPCRVRKSRCDGHRPKCASCERMGFECTYEMPNSSANLIISKDVITGLEARVIDLERIVRQHQSRLDGANVESHCTTPPSSHHETTGGLAPAPLSGTVVVAIQNQEADSRSDATETDGMAISLIDDDDYGYFGPSSNISLMRIMFQAMAQRGYLSTTSSPTSVRRFSSYDANILSIPRPEGLPTAREGSPMRQGVTGLNHLPPSHETEALIRRYFENTGRLFPYIHEPSFLETYRQLKQNAPGVEMRRTWLGLLNMVLAMASCGTRHDSMDGEPSGTTKSAIFYRRAQELCKTHMLRGTTLEAVQYLLLTSQYLQGTQKAVQTWITHGLAVKSALAIGLHSKEALRRLPPIEQEMGKRTWFGCVLLDRSLSMTYGRPSAIPEFYIKLDLPTMVIGELDGGASVTFYNATINLYKVLWKVMGSLYGHNLGCDEPSNVDIVAQIFRLQDELDLWKQSLPVSLCLISSSNLNEVDQNHPHLERFRFILTLRYLNTQLLLQRPLLTKLLKADFESNQSVSLEKVQEQLTRNCAKSAEEIIFIIHSVLTNPNLGGKFLGAWWFTIYYTFNAALVIFGSLLIPPDAFDIQTGSLSQMEQGRKTLRQAIEALLQIEEGNVLVTRCIAYLRQLARLIEEWSTSFSTSSLATTNPPMSSALDSGFAASLNPNILVDIPELRNDIAFEDEIELGPFVNNEFQRWFAGTPWQND